MGATVSRTSSASRRVSVNDILNEKEYVFLVLQTEIDKLIRKVNYKDLHQIEREINCHISELKNLIRYKKWKTETIDRAQRLIYNYEISLAKVKSCIFNTISKNKAFKKQVKESTCDQTYENVQKHVENDIYISKDIISPNPLNADETGSNLMAFSERDTDSDTDEPAYANLADLELIWADRQPRPPEVGGVKTKPPIPNPRGGQDRLVKEVPNFYKRLNEILDKDRIDTGDVEEVIDIRRRANEVCGIFEDKIDEIFRRYEETVTVDV